MKYDVLRVGMKSNRVKVVAYNLTRKNADATAGACDETAKSLPVVHIPVPHEEYEDGETFLGTPRKPKRTMKTHEITDLKLTEDEKLTLQMMAQREFETKDSTSSVVREQKLLQKLNSAVLTYDR
jgi:hypothetical protein